MSVEGVRFCKSYSADMKKKLVPGATNNTTKAEDGE